ncbi:hypothetical protein SAMN05216410_1990 [Sanguibacter gelidistatuariae]|uniref:Double zinc ribbon n=1 Tax=Sanguibacter gelidistatuariae TaxID=1814289 RepID=A0A1G6MWB8_9MICO|nr:hypothetical protein [Sanguibacter gelidistatuariae]SDC59860.1 hypothetical protein SAMN05216410_1990 [Sanguibacter gelidistatuariae]
MQYTSVTCPECGTPSDIMNGRRDASDFCPSCDFPLFWSSTAIAVRGADDDSGDALRRLPGTSGKGVSYSVPCPTCGELNLPTAWVCLRCAGSMTPPPPPVLAPVPQPVPAPPPPTPVVPLEEAPRFRWWVLVAAALALTTFVVVVLQLAC